MPVRCDLPVTTGSKVHRQTPSGLRDREVLKLLIVTDGGIRVDGVKEALKVGAGSFWSAVLYSSKDVGHAVDESPGELNREEIDQFKIRID